MGRMRVPRLFMQAVKGLDQGTSSWVQYSFLLICALQIGLAIALRYALTRRAFSPAAGAEALLLDDPTHQAAVCCLSSPRREYRHHLSRCSPGGQGLRCEGLEVTTCNLQPA